MAKTMRSMKKKPPYYIQHIWEKAYRNGIAIHVCLCFGAGASEKSFRQEAVIDTEQIFLTYCRECEREEEHNSLEAARNSARHHINEDIGDENPRPFFDHTVTITEAWRGH